MPPFPAETILCLDLWKLLWALVVFLQLWKVEGAKSFVIPYAICAIQTTLYPVLHKFHFQYTKKGVGPQKGKNFPHFLSMGPLPHDKHNLNFAWKALRWIRSASTLTSFLDRDWIFLEIRQTIHEAQKLDSGCCSFTTTFAFFFNPVGRACPAMTSPSFESHNRVSLHFRKLNTCLHASTTFSALDNQSESCLWEILQRHANFFFSFFRAIFFIFQVFFNDPCFGYCCA